MKKQELLEMAKTFKIRGRHDMKVGQLEIAIRKASAGSGEVKIVRAGKNLSGNKPYVGKVYAVSTIRHESEFKQAPKQVQAIVGFMLTTGFKGRGGDVIKAAVKAGHLKTRCKDPRVLFGYLAKDLQRFGATARYEHG